MGGGQGVGAQEAAPAMSVLAYAPDLMDRSRVSAAGAGAAVVGRPDGLTAAAVDDVVAVDVSRPGVLEALPSVRARRIIGFGSHVDRTVLEAARAAGCTEVLARSAFFSRLSDLFSD